MKNKETYEFLNSLEPEKFLDWEFFRTGWDFRSGHKERGTAQEQYKKGLKAKEEYKTVYISEQGTWAADHKEGQGFTISYEGIGYHAHSADLLHGFLDSGVPVVVCRYDRETGKSSKTQIN